MIDSSIELLNHFVSDYFAFSHIKINETEISHDLWHSPQKISKMKEGYAGAVYIFSISNKLGYAPQGRVLKVGKVGPNSNARFTSQHYSPLSARSTLAGAIINNEILWRYIGFPGEGVNVGEWIKNNTDRDNFYFNSKKLVDLFEIYSKAFLGPVFEGSLSKTNQKFVFMEE